MIRGLKREVLKIHELLAHYCAGAVGLSVERCTRSACTVRHFGELIIT